MLCCATAVLPSQSSPPHAASTAAIPPPAGLLAHGEWGLLHDGPIYKLRGLVQDEEHRAFENSSECG